MDILAPIIDLALIGVVWLLWRLFKKGDSFTTPGEAAQRSRQAEMDLVILLGLDWLRRHDDG